VCEGELLLESGVKSALPWEFSSWDGGKVTDWDPYLELPMRTIGRAIFISSGRFSNMLIWFSSSGWEDFCDEGSIMYWQDETMPPCCKIRFWSVNLEVWLAKVA